MGRVSRRFVCLSAHWKGGGYEFRFYFAAFPQNVLNFCDRLRRNGANVLGIGDAPYAEIPVELHTVLTEYYRVDNLANYDAMVRAMGYFTHRYGKIDWLRATTNTGWNRTPRCAPTSISRPAPRAISSSGSSSRAA